MPPKPARRSTRYASNEIEPEPVQIGLARPNLPPLKGTPSTRRQYTYGSGVEPPPRVGAGLHRMDLSNAVNQALSNGGEPGEEASARPNEPRSASTRAERDTRSKDSKFIAISRSTATLTLNSSPTKNNNERHWAFGC